MGVELDVDDTVDPPAKGVLPMPPAMCVDAMMYVCVGRLVGFVQVQKKKKSLRLLLNFCKRNEKARPLMQLERTLNAVVFRAKDTFF